MIMESLLSSISLLLILSSSFLANSLPVYKTPEAPCRFTPYPTFCKYSLAFNKPRTIYDYAKTSISKSLKDATNFLSLVQNQLKQPSTSYQSTIRALEDCQFLAQLNIDSLSYALQTINNNAAGVQSLPLSLTSDLLHLLSATLTNQQTCLEGLQIREPPSSRIMNGLLTPLSNGTKSFSTSLALFTDSWVPKYMKGAIFLAERNNHFFFKKWWPFIRRKKPVESFINKVKISQMVVVNPSGNANFTAINDAVAAAPNNTDSKNGYFVIYVVAGVYNEYVSIPKNKKYLMMIGDGINKTVISGNRSVVDGWTTFNSATFAVVGEGFVAMNITFQNTAGAAKHQAVAVRNGADMSTFYNCSFEGYQDTLYTHSLRQFYRDCEIYGTIDYIFGNAAVVLQDCKIYSRLPMSGQFNAITAQGRSDPNQNTGTAIQNCSILAAEDLGSTKSYLGRPWKNYSRTVVMESFIDSLIDPTGWAPWSGDFALETLYYAEFDNNGPGSDTSNRVKWLGYHVINETEAANFTVTNFIQGNFWLNTTEVPYYAGLL